MRPTPFVFGKVPARGDFVRAGRLGPLVDELDGWLQRGLLLHRAPPDGAAVGFAFFRPGAMLLGAFRPSRDRAGRAFPLTVGAEAALPPGTTAARLLADHVALVARAASCAAEVVEGRVEPDGVTAYLEAAPAALPDAPSAALPDALPDAPPDEAAEGAPGLAALSYDAFLDQPPAAVFAPGAVAEAVLGPLGTTLRNAPAAPRYGLGLPAPAVPAARAHGAAFWLDAASRALGVPPATASLLWTASAASAASARVVLFLGTPAPGAFPYPLTGREDEAVYDLDAPGVIGSGASDGSPSAPTLRALLGRL